MLFLMFLCRLVLAAPSPLTVTLGGMALAFELPALNPGIASKTVGKPSVALGDLSGVLPSHPKKAIVVHFFNLEPKDESLKVLDKLQQRYRAKGVQILAICGGVSQTSLSATLQGQSVRFPVLFDNHQIVAARYGVSEHPMTIIVDGDGRVFAIGKPPAAVLEDELSQEIDGLLASVK
jgi:peroxiredoxin